METLLRAALLDWLRADETLAATINLVAEEAPVAASAPWLGIAASASTDWGTKDRAGREVRLALELHLRGDDPATAAYLTGLVEARVESLPREQPQFEIATARFLRARVEQRRDNRRAVLVEYVFRILAN